MAHPYRRIVLCAALIAAPPLQAGVVAAPAAQPASPAATSAAHAKKMWAPVNPTVEGYHLRCWQQGKLIIDEFREGAMPDTWASTAEVLSTARTGPRVLDGKNATCVVKQAQRRRAATPPNTP